MIAGTERATLTLSGVGFVPESVVRISRGGEELVQRKVRYVSETEIELELLAEDISEPEPLEVAVVNPEPGGGASDPVVLEVGVE